MVASFPISKSLSKFNNSISSNRAITHYWQGLAVVLGVAFYALTKGVLVRNRCVKFAFNNGSFGAYFPAYCEPIKGRFCCNSCLLQSFIKSIMPAYRSIRCSLFANALLSLACCWRWCSFLPCSYCSEKSAIRSPFALCACLWCWC